MGITAEYWIEKLFLEPHPEGGFFRENYRSAESISAEELPERYSGERNYGTSIYFLLRSDDVSHLHRLQTDEIWHYYAGSNLVLHLLDDAQGHRKQLLGPQPELGHQYQVVIPKNTWFGATVEHPHSYSLVGCTMSPGFDFADFEQGERESLLEKYPGNEDIILKLTTP